VEVTERDGVVRKKSGFLASKGDRQGLARKKGMRAGVRIRTGEGV